MTYGVKSKTILYSISEIAGLLKNFTNKHGIESDHCDGERKVCTDWFGLAMFGKQTQVLFIVTCCMKV